MAICYMMWKTSKTFNDTHEDVKRIRPVSSPNPGFMTQLMNWWKKRNSPVTATRLYAVGHHSDLDSTIIFKDKPVSSTSLYSSGVFILEGPEIFYIWIGNNHLVECATEAVNICEQIKRFEPLSPMDTTTIQEGCEPESFWKDIGGNKGLGIAPPPLIIMPLLLANQPTMIHSPKPISTIENKVKESEKKT